MSITLRPFTNSEAEFEFLFAAFNSCVEWLAAKGYGEQWGPEPWGADIKERLRKNVLEEGARGARRWIAEVDAEPAGYLDITPFRPDYLPVSAQENPGTETFVKSLVVHRKFVGKGVGEFLLRHAKKVAVEERTEWLRLDCWRGPPGRDGLVRYYEEQGFVKAREFSEPPKKEGEKGRPGQLFEMKVGDFE
ncbi:acyl-CoA N-acyltransferase [Mycena polygramma]|nr:acyl-CoA N-acyltransferase [Mycena polygramma]